MSPLQHRNRKEYITSSMVSLAAFYIYLEKDNDVWDRHVSSFISVPEAYHEQMYLCLEVSRLPPLYRIFPIRETSHMSNSSSIASARMPDHIS